MSKLSERVTPGAGNTILNGVSDPLVGQGIDGDFFINTTVQTIFGPKTAGVWGSATSLIGGTSFNILSGTLDPQDSEGFNDQYYVNTTNNTIFGPKTGGAWGNAQPISGIGTLITGVIDPVNGLGSDGDFYTNTDTNTLFGPKTGGVWPAGVNLLGPFGGSGVAVTNMLNTVSVLEGDNTPSVSEGTHIATAYQDYPSYINLNLTNTGPVNLGSVSISSSNPDFTVSLQPLTIIGGFSSSTFIITFDSSTLGSNTSTITINNDSVGSPAYSFDVSANNVVVPTAIFVETSANGGSDANDGLTPITPKETIAAAESLMGSMTLPPQPDLEIIIGVGDFEITNTFIVATRWDTVRMKGVSVGTLTSSDVTSSVFTTETEVRNKLQTMLYTNGNDNIVSQTNDVILNLEDLILKNTNEPNYSMEINFNTIKNCAFLECNIDTGTSASGQVFTVDDSVMFATDNNEPVSLVDADNTCSFVFTNFFFEEDTGNVGNDVIVQIPGTFTNCEMHFDHANFEIDIPTGSVNFSGCSLSGASGVTVLMYVGITNPGGIVNITDCTIDNTTSDVAISGSSTVILHDSSVVGYLSMSKTTLPNINLLTITGSSTVTSTSGQDVVANGVGVFCDLTSWDTDASNLTAQNGAQIDVSNAPTSGTFTPAYGSGVDGNGSEIF